MSKHTPGPWLRVVKWGADITIYAPTKSDIATVADKDGEGLPDARLIAAAPDLFDACQAALLTLNINKRYVTCEPLVAKLRAAIEKATGAK